MREMAEEIKHGIAGVGGRNGGQIGVTYTDATKMGQAIWCLVTLVPGPATENVMMDCKPFE